MLAAALVVVSSARAQAPGLTEAAAVSLALARAPLRDLLGGEVAIEQGRARTASSYSNPELSYIREQTFGPLGTAEDSLAIAQTIDLANQRGLRGEAGEERARAARLEGEAARLAIAADVRVRFYDVVYRRDRALVLESWASRIAEALEIVRRRERSGDAATYELRRLERERAVAAGRSEVEQAALEGAQARLLARLGRSGAAGAIQGSLLPDSEPPELATLRAASRSRPDLRALALKVAAAARERNAAERGWIPRLTLQGGWKGVDFGEQGRADGFIAGASLALPLWDRAAGVERAAEGEAQAAHARRALLEAELEVELEGARVEAVRLLRTAIDFQDRTAAASGELVRIVSAGYAGGELGLLELLDAYRGAADDAVIALDMALAARRARIELDRMTGATVP